MRRHHVVYQLHPPIYATIATARICG